GAAGRCRITLQCLPQASARPEERGPWAAGYQGSRKYIAMTMKAIITPKCWCDHAISRACLFGDNALKPMLSTCFEERGTVTYELFAELNACFLIVSD